MSPATIIPWTAEWLFHYEIRAVIGHWNGGGHEFPPSSSRSRQDELVRGRSSGRSPSGYAVTARPVMELEADSVAFAVMTRLGVESGEYPFGMWPDATQTEGPGVRWTA